MVSFLRRLIRSERGQVLPIVLVLLVIGGLIIIPFLNFTFSNLFTSRNIKEHTQGVYAADAGIEQAILCIKQSLAVPAQLPQNVNNMQVAIQSQNMGPHILAYFTQVLDVTSSGHYTWLSVTGAIVWDQSADAYKYTVTVTRQPEALGTLHIASAGARLPVGYNYKPNSANNFSSNLSQSEPASDTTDGAGAHMISWNFDTPRPSLPASDPVKTQTFHITGSGDLEGDYCWVVMAEADVGTVGEITGILHRITATASYPGTGEVTGKVTADVIVDTTTHETSIISWQVIPE